MKFYTGDGMMTETVYSIDSGGNKWAPQWVDNPVRLKCGVCQHGVITKKFRKNRIGVISKCRVCGAKTKAD